MTIADASARVGSIRRSQAVWWAAAVASVAIAGTWLLVGELHKSESAAQLLWRWRLRTRVTTKGAEPSEQSWIGTCARCGDAQGVRHECRDFGR